MNSLNSIFHRLSVLFLSLILASCADNSNENSSVIAEWSENTSSLTINGTTHGSSQYITIKNAASDEELAKTLVGSNVSWSKSIRQLAVIPCSVRIESQNSSVTTPVKNAPENCNASINRARALHAENEILRNTLIPDSVITSPATDLIIEKNSVVNFVGEGIAASSAITHYQWDFDDVRNNVTVQNPGEVIFKTAGVFHVKLTVTDLDGLSDPTPAERTIIVLDKNVSPQTLPPVVSIDTPAVDQTITTGDLLNFSGSAIDPDRSDDVTYIWDFGGVVPNSLIQNPGNVRFNRSGVFVITLWGIDERGNVGNDKVQITVMDPVQNSAPVGTIRGPGTDIIINLGDSIFLQGDGSDVDGHLPISYHWALAGVAPDSNLQNPGLITFDQPGIYEIKLTVTDSLGLSDINPPIRKITVIDTTPVNHAPPDGKITTPAGDMSIEAGTTLLFTGEGTSPSNNNPLTYFWDMGGAAPNIVNKDAGEIVFNFTGVYTVVYRITDSEGNVDPTPDVRVITVTPPGSTTAPPQMFSHIIMPEADVTINAGESISFTGFIDPAVNGPYTYFWNFDGVVPNSRRLIPGSIRFQNPGVYSISFSAIDADGYRDPSPMTRVITVVEPNIITEPEGNIVQPATDVTITTGESLTFEGSAIDTTGNNALNYLWTFSGAVPNSASLSPGLQTFNSSGDFLVTFKVTDSSTGLSDSTPATINVTVNPVTPIPPNQFPDGIIITPTRDLTIKVGGTVEFRGEGINPINSDPLNYVWDFGNGSRSTAKFPGNVTFNQAGVFLVTLTVNHNYSSFDPTPSSVVITVVP